MKFRPLHEPRRRQAHRGRREKPPEALSSPTTAKEKPSQGEVIAVGPGGATSEAPSFSPT